MNTSPFSVKRLLGIFLLAGAVFLAWKSNWFRAEKNLWRYPELQLTYTTCRFERIAHYKGLPTSQIVFTSESRRYVMEDGVWKEHFDGPKLAGALSGGGTVRAWVHPDYPHVLRGIVGGKADVPPQWGLEYDQRNARAGIWLDSLLALAGISLCFWKRRAALT